jgi:uncharacterized protein
MNMNRQFLLSLLPSAGLALALAATPAATAADAPKRVLLVTTTTGFRHSSIETAEQIIAKVAKESGVFTITAQASVTPPKNPGRNATDEQKAEFAKAEAAYKEQIAKVLAEKMSPAALKMYDGIIFANTTGDLPVPDKEAFMQWIKDGGAFVGMHSATDTFHGYRPFIEMIGGEFLSHGAQVVVNCLNNDPAHPSTKHLGAAWDLQGKKEEIYLFKSYQQKAVRNLLSLDKHPNNGTPGHYPVSWCKDFGKGKVFYTSLGHNEYVWEMPEFQAHLLGGLKWSLGLEKGSAEPQAK